MRSIFPTYPFVLPAFSDVSATVPLPPGSRVVREVSLDKGVADVSWPLNLWTHRPDPAPSVRNPGNNVILRNEGFIQSIANTVPTKIPMCVKIPVDHTHLSFNINNLCCTTQALSVGLELTDE